VLDLGYRATRAAWRTGKQFVLSQHFRRVIDILLLVKYWDRHRLRLIGRESVVRWCDPFLDGPPRSVWRRRKAPRRAATLRIQALARGWMHRRTIRRAAAERIQAVARGWMHRRAVAQLSIRGEMIHQEDGQDAEPNVPVIQEDGQQDAEPIVPVIQEDAQDAAPPAPPAENPVRRPTRARRAPNRLHF
jgi:hypothetical protein